jgi:hypothetical protein
LTFFFNCRESATLTQGETQPLCDKLPLRRDNEITA